MTLLRRWVRAPAFFPVLVTLLLVVGPELALRLVGWPPSAEPALPDDPDTLWSLAPGAGRVLGSNTSISSVGLRGPERGAKAAGVRRIAFLGDSSVFGVLVDEPFADQVERRLQPGVETINAGVPGFSSEQALRQLRKRVLPLKPDLVVVATLWSDNNFDAFVDRDLYAARATVGARVAGALLGFATFRAAARLSGAEAPRTIGWGLLGQQTLLGRRRVALADYAATLDAIVAADKAAGAETMFLVLANEEDLKPARAWSWDPYRAAMRDAARRHGTPIVDVPTVFRASGLGKQALLVDAMHPSRDGHRLIAEAIVTALRAAGWDRGSVMHGGGGGAPVVGADPWVEPATGPGTPRIAGVVQGPRGRDAVRVEALDPTTGAVLDAVDLPGPAPFALDPTGDHVRLRVLTGTPPTKAVDLAGADLDLTRGAAWALRVDVPTGRVTRP
jgi:hypothetical protein